MTPTETAAMLRAFHTAWPSFEVNEEVRRLWAHTCRGIDRGVGLAAYETIKREDEWAPSPARFLKVCANEDRGRGLPPAETATEDCEYCDHGFIPGRPIEERVAMPDGTVKVIEASTVKPCEHCRPAQYAAWKERTAKANARRSRTADEDRTYPANPQEGLAQVRDVLANAKPWRRPADG